MANLVELFDNIVQMQNLNGVPLANGKMYVYALGRTRLMDTWSDVDGSSLNTNPIILDNAGQCHCYVSDDFDYTIVVCDAYDNEIFSLDKYLYSDGSHSHADVAMAPSESIAVSSYHVGETTVYVPYLTGDVGKVYTGIDPVNVDNVNDTISVSHVGLGLQDPLYFVEDSETACIIGCSAQTEIPSATSGKWEDAADTVIANSAQWAEGTTYEAGTYVDITDNTISVTGLQPSGDYADSTALDTKLDTTAFSDVSGSFITAVNIPESANWNSTYETVSTNSAGWTSNPQIPVTGINGIKISESGNLVVFEVSADYATESFVNDAVDSAVSGKLDSATYAAQSGNFYLTSNPAGYITGVPSSYLQNSDLTIVDNKITEISGIELSAGDEFPQSATEAIEVVTANSGDWNTVTAKLDKADSGNFYPMDGNPSGFLTTETDWTNTITAASSYAYEQATAAIPQPQDLSYISGKVDDLSSDKLDATAFSTVSGSFLTAHQALPESATWNTVTSKLDTTAFSTVSGSFLTAHQDLSDYQTIAGMTAYQEAGNYLTADALDNVSGTWNTVTNKLDTTAFSTVSGDFITAHQSLPESATWNTVTSKLDSTAFSTVSGSFLTSHQSLSESANWNSTYNTVHDNSASWTGGGGGADYTAGAGIDITNDVISVTGKEDTITYGYSGDAISSLNGHAILSDPIPYEVYGISASTNISAYESDSALWISGRDWTPELNDKLDSTAQVVTSTAGDGTYVTAINGMGISGQGGGGGSTYTGDAQGALDEVYTNSASWNSTYNTVRDNSASWTGGGGGDFTGLFQAQYGTTTYNDIKNAVDNHKIVYCQSGGRMAFLAYSGANNYEFQYYRSLTGHTTANQGDQVFVYTIANNNTWGVTTRNTYTEIKPGAGLYSAFNNGTAAKLTFSVSADIINATASVAANSANWQSAYDQLGNVTALLDSL